MCVGDIADGNRVARLFEQVAIVGFIWTPKRWGLIAKKETLSLARRQPGEESDVKTFTGEGQQQKLDQWNSVTLGILMVHLSSALINFLDVEMTSPGEDYPLLTQPC